jgi:hypothetical protein
MPHSFLPFVVSFSCLLLRSLVSRRGVSQPARILGLRSEIFLRSFYSCTKFGLRSTHRIMPLDFYFRLTTSVSQLSCHNSSDIRKIAGWSLSTSGTQVAQIFSVIFRPGDRSYNSNCVRYSVHFSLDQRPYSCQQGDQLLILLLKVF